MATYPEPIELVPEFDSTNFPINISSSAQGGGVDVAKLNFPIAQGSESFPFGLASDAQLSLTSTSGQSTLEQLPSLLKIQNLENGGITNFYNDTALGVQTNPLSINSSGITIIQGTVSNPPVNPTDIATKDYVDSNTSNLITTATSSATPLPIPIISSSTPGSVSVLVDSDNGITYTPSTNTLNVSQLSGNASTSTLSDTATNALACSGNSATATTASACSGNSVTATTATNSNLININTTSTSTNYAIPLLDSAILSGFKPLRVGANLTYNPASKTLITQAINGTSIVSSPVIEASSGGIFRVMDTAGTISSTISNSNNIMIMTPSNVGNNTFFVNTNNSPPVNVGSTPSSYGGSNAGLGITWNTVSGTGATDFVNYAQGAGAGLGGFNFFSGSTSNAIAPIGFIPRVQSAYSAISDIMIPTYNWVNGTITAAISGLPSLAGNNIFSGTNNFSVSCPTSSINATTANQLTNYQTVQALVAGGGVGAALLAGTNVFTAQNTFNTFCPQTAVAPTVNESLTNKLYIDSKLTALQYTYSKKANFYNVINAPTTEFFINISNPAPGGISDWGYNDFFTIRYKLSMTYPNVPIPNANPNASIYSGNIDIYPIRIPSTLIIGTSKINVINNDINGNAAYYIGTSQPTWAPNGRQMWSYNNYSLGVNPPPLYLMAVNNDIIGTISMKFILNNPNSAGANPPDSTPNIFWCDFTFELISWGSSTPLKITTTGFTTNF